jgi:hypothetical protein
LVGGVHDHEDAIVAVHAGEGGVDAMDWAQMLQRMYLRWAEKRGYEAEVFDQSYGEEAGKSTTFEVRGPDAYGFLNVEHGVHRLVRISPFDSQARRQTSFALVDVVPSLPEVDAEVVRDKLACLKDLKMPAEVKVMPRSSDMAKELATTPGSTFETHAGADGVLVGAPYGTRGEVGVTRLAAFDAATGEQLWQQQSTDPTVDYTGWPRVADGRVYHIERELLRRTGGEGLVRFTVVAFDLHGGAELTRTPLPEFYDPDDPDDPDIHGVNVYLDQLGEGVIMVGLSRFHFGGSQRVAAVVVAE